VCVPRGFGAEIAVRAAAVCIVGGRSVILEEVTWPVAVVGGGRASCMVLGGPPVQGRGVCVRPCLSMRAG